MMVSLLRYSILFLLPLLASSDYLTYPGGLSPVNLTCETSSNPEDLYGTPCQVTAADNIQLSTSLIASHVRTGGESFRAHPMLISCLQRFSAKLSATPEIFQFYLSQSQSLSIKTNDTAVDAEMLLYHQAGLAVSFKVKNTTFQVLLETAVSSCVERFAAVQFSVGLIELGNDTLDLQLRESFRFYPDGINDTYYGLVDASLIPRTPPVCNTTNLFLDNSSYPVDDSPAEQVVGRVYRAVSNSSEEFMTLLQYPATNIDFYGCPQRITGYSIQQRSSCPARVMSFRMYRTFKVLAGLLGNDIGDLVVVRSWSLEPLNFTDPQCFSTPLNTTLFSEGRAMLLNAKGALTLSQLALLSRCAGFDYVYYGCGYVLVAVRKQRSTTPLTVIFPESVLLPITPYGDLVSLYPLSPSISTFSPLLDSDGIRASRLSTGYTVAQLAGGNRFFRMHPVLVQCLQLLTDSLSAYRPYYSIRIQQAYSRNLSSQLEDYTTGLAVKISVYPTGFPLLNLTLVAIRSCASHVSLQHNTLRKLHLGLNSDSLYLAIAKDFNAWNTTEFSSYSHSTFYGWAYYRYNAGLSNTLVNPSNENMSCANTILSSAPDPSYISPYTLPSVIAYLLSVQPGNCVPEINTQFCGESAPSILEVIEELLEIFKRKHWLVPTADLTNALTQCFSLCGTCTEGNVWIQKLAHCDNMLHWAPFRLISEPDNMHFYVMENMTIKEYACGGSRLCISKSPLFAVLAYTVESLYRPDPNKGQELALYSMTDNPIPVYTLVDTLFALTGVGNVTVWVTSENDLLVLKPVLRILMLDNYDVTCVDIRLFQADRLSAVQRQLDGNIHEWTSNGCPAYSRDVIAPYTITIVNTSQRARRDVHAIQEGANYGDYLATRWKFAERRWIEKQIL